MKGIGRKGKALLFLLFTPFLLTGCWDRTELNDLAFKMGLAVDVAPGNMIQASAQIAIPAMLGGGESSSGSSDKGYLVATGVGRDVRDAVENMQSKLSRRVIAGQRRGIFIGEAMAQRGIRTIIDTNTRDPDTRLRTDIFIIKGGEARDILNVYYPFERVPTLGALKIHRMLGGSGDASLRDFLEDEFEDTTYPTIPALEMYQRSNEGQAKQGFRFAGRAILDKKQMKLLGYLNVDQTFYRAWMLGTLRRYVLTAELPKANEYVSIHLNGVRGKVNPVLQKGKLVFYITLSGRGSIRENGSTLDLTNQQQLGVAKKTLEDYVSTMTLATIQGVQKKYGLDIFSFGESVHKKYPYQWKQLREQWPNIFPSVEVHVQAHITPTQIGLTGPFLE